MGCYTQTRVMTTSNHNGGISRNRNLNLKKKEKNLAGTLENDFTMVLLVNTMLRRDTSGDHRVLKCVRILFSHPREVSDSLCVPKLSSSCVFFFFTNLSERTSNRAKPFKHSKHEKYNIHTKIKISSLASCLFHRQL